MNPLVIVISGPSGVGKDATIAKMKESGSKAHCIVTATTRPKRKNEIDGVHYYFLSKEQFAHRIKKEEFLEYAEVYGNYYGVLKSEIRQTLDKGEDVIIKVDVQGAATLKQKIPNAIFIFLEPPSIEHLENRIRKRSTDTEADLSIRLGMADNEIKLRTMFDCTIKNIEGNLEATARMVEECINRYRGKRGPVVI